MAAFESIGEKTRGAAVDRLSTHNGHWFFSHPTPDSTIYNERFHAPGVTDFMPVLICLAISRAFISSDSLSIP
jgi:hypothetical protein